MPFPDNKHITGPLDRQWVSRTEPYEVQAFVDAYLKSRAYEMSDKNRDIVRQAVMNYSGRSPIARDDLVAYLDRLYQK